MNLIWVFPFFRKLEHNFNLHVCGLIKLFFLVNLFRIFIVWEQNEKKKNKYLFIKVK